MQYLEIAQKFISRLTEYTQYNINIMDERGIIIASRNPERVGTFHEVAYNIVKNNKQIVEVDTSDSFLGVQPGVNLSLIYRGAITGVIGVTGNPSEVKPIALIVKMSMETMMEYEYEKEVSTKRRNLKDQFINQLLYQNQPDIRQINIDAEKLQYSTKYIRIPIYIEVDKHQFSRVLLERIKREEKHTSQDISLITREGNILVYKTIDEMLDPFANYKYIIGEYLSPFLMYCKERDYQYKIYVGTFQTNLSYYRSAYEHCLWLKSNVITESTSLFFYDYVDQYMKSLVPKIEYHKIFNVFDEKLDQKFKNNILSSIQNLKEYNYNMGIASQKMFIHKNTLAFRLEKIKNKFNADIYHENKQREFIEHLYHYLLKK